MLEPRNVRDVLKSALEELIVNHFGDQTTTDYDRPSGGLHPLSDLKR
jgi:hypothetical protein